MWRDSDGLIDYGSGPRALALRGIAMAQLGELERAKALRRRAARGFRAGFVRVSCLVVWWDFGGSVRLKSLRENQPIAKSVPQSLP